MILEAVQVRPPRGWSLRQTRTSSRTRRGRRGRRGVQASDGEDIRWRPGLCRKDISCGQEAACTDNKKTNQHICICPHDKSPPDESMRCPIRRTVPVPIASPIHNVFPPTHDSSKPGSSATNSSPTLPPHLGVPRDPSVGPIRAKYGIVIPSVGVAIFVLACLLSCLIFWRVRKKYKKNRKNNTPRSLSKGPLGSELFLPNPQYSVGMANLGLGPGEGGGLRGQGQGGVVTLIDHHTLSLQESIGEGCFGKVFRGELRDLDAGLQTVAVKVLKESASREAEEDFMREVEVMSAFQHPHILRLVGVVPREPQTAPCMVFEFMPFGDLTEVLRCSSKNPWCPPRPGLPPLTVEALLGVALQISLGMRYLAAQRFVHRDLACRNCLVGQNLTVKIADFGMSRDVYSCDYYKMGGSRALPVRWMSPEALLYGRFTLESDVWSFGVVLWEIFTRGKLPYYGHANDEALKLVLQGVLLQVPDSADCPPAVVDLMRCCWKTEPRDRLRFPDICARLEEALEEAVKGLNLVGETDSGSLGLDFDLPRPPGFPAALALSLPALPDDLSCTGWYGQTMPHQALSDGDLNDHSDDLMTALEPRGREEGLLDPDNYLLPRAPDPSRVQYMEPIAD